MMKLFSVFCISFILFFAFTYTAQAQNSYVDNVSQSMLSFYDIDYSIDPEIFSLSFPEPEENREPVIQINFHNKNSQPRITVNTAFERVFYLDLLAAENKQGKNKSGGKLGWILVGAGVGAVGGGALWFLLGTNLPNSTDTSGDEFRAENGDKLPVYIGVGAIIGAIMGLIFSPN